MSAFINQLYQRPGTTLFLLALPLSFFPKLIDGDTQPWPLLATFLLLLVNKEAQKLRSADMLVIAIAFAGIITYLARSGFTEDFFRFSYKLVSFSLLFVCCSALPSSLVARAMRWVITIWFLVGLLQTIAVALDVNIYMPGRFVEGRSGVPSLTPEPSLYGLLSSLALIYLLYENQQVKFRYIIMAVGNVFLSGSILAILSMGFLVFFIRLRILIMLAFLAPLMLWAVASNWELAFLNRFVFLFETGADLVVLISDYSINLRIGHVVYTLWTVLLESLFFQTPISFESSYNNWAASNNIFFPTGSEFILTGSGDLIYRGGVFGAILLFMTFVQAACLTPRKRILKVLIIFTLLLTQLGVSSAFLMLFASQRPER